MDIKKRKSPIIIIGMHRSGTSMLTRFLEDAGVFLGSSKDINHESHFFIELNEWILNQVNATWDNPYNFQFLNEHVMNNLIRVSKYHLSSYKRKKYLDLINFIKYSSIENIDFLWGWKDPRNSITLPIWKNIFPDAKIIHIYRNPIDVANSLLAREQTLESSFQSNMQTSFKESLLYPTKVGYSFSVRTNDIREGIKLWKQYIGYIEKYDKDYGNILHIQYEYFLENPIEVLNEIKEYLEVDIETKIIENIAKKADISRQFSFINNRELYEVYQSVKLDETVIKYGYGSILKNEKK